MHVSGRVFTRMKLIQLIEERGTEIVLSAGAKSKPGKEARLLQSKANDAVHLDEERVIQWLIIRDIRP
jgi:hypothetical protein